MACVGGQVVVPAAATKLTTLLLATTGSGIPAGLSDGYACQEIQLQSDSGNSGSIFIGGSNVTLTANIRQIIAKTDNVPRVFRPAATSSLNTDQIYVIGTVNDKLYVHIIA